ncbi:hypothetical protein EON67_01700, partial [archaeon]
MPAMDGSSSGAPRSLAAMQVDALLAAIRFRGAGAPALYSLSRALASALISAPATTVTADAHVRAHPGLPLRRATASGNLTLNFEAPEGVMRVGSVA